MKKTHRLTVAFAPVILVAGCVAYEPVPLDGAAELASLRATTLDGVRVEHARPGQAEGATSRAIDLSDGLDEDELVAVALTLSPALRTKRLEAGDAQAQLIEAGLWPNPEIGVSWRTAIGGATGQSADADLLIDLLQPWRRGARVDAATARTKEVAADGLAEEWRLVRDVRLRRLDVLAAERTLALLGEEAELRERTKELTVRRRGAGEGTELDVSAAELDVAEIRRDRLRAETDLGTARRALNELIGVPPGFVLQLTASGQPLAVTVFEDVPDADLEQRLLAGRFELRALEAAYDRSEHELRLAVQSQFPNLKLGLSYERDSGGDRFLGPAAELEIPLFNRNQGEIAAKSNARDVARANYVAALHRLRAEAYEARAQLERARIEVEMQEKDVLPLVQRSQDLVERAFDARDVGILDRVTAQQRALRARVAYLDSVIRYQRAVIEVETATGMPLARPSSPVVPQKQ